MRKCLHIQTGLVLPQHPMGFVEIYYNGYIVMVATLCRVSCILAPERMREKSKKHQTPVMLFLLCTVMPMSSSLLISRGKIC